LQVAGDLFSKMVRQGTVMIAALWFGASLIWEFTVPVAVVSKPTQIYSEILILEAQIARAEEAIVQLNADGHDTPEAATHTSALRQRLEGLLRLNNRRASAVA
jgi:hypothetical protein